MSSSNLAPLYALILAGGKSRRMHQDKTKLDYGHERLLGWRGVKNQIDYLHRLFKSVEVKESFVSCRSDQKDEIHLSRYQLILDQLEYDHAGPLTGILSAFECHSQVAWLVVACDVPLVDELTLSLLLQHRSQEKLAVTYLNESCSK